MSLELLRSGLADRYRLERKLGKGGMATLSAAESRGSADVAEATGWPLQPRLATSHTTPAQARHSEDLEAYQLFLKGRHFRYSRLDLRSALRRFEPAAERSGFLFASALRFPMFRRLREEPVIVELNRRRLGGAGAGS